MFENFENAHTSNKSRDLGHVTFFFKVVFHKLCIDYFGTEISNPLHLH